MRRTALLTTCAVVLACTPALLAPTASAQSEPPTVELVDDGAEPRAELRLALVAGTAMQVDMRQKITITQKQGERSRTIKTPAITLSLTSTVSAVAPDGTATIDFSYDETDVDDDGSASAGDLDQIREALSELEGISGSYTVSPTGASSEIELSVPPDVSPSTRTLVEQLQGQTAQLAVPYPDEAVGVGARWAANQEIALQGVTIRQRTRYTLEERDGTSITLAVVVDQRAGKATLGTTQLVSQRGKGKGTTELDLSRPFPEAGDLDLKVVQRLRAGGTTLDQTVKTKVTVRATE